MQKIVAIVSDLDDTLLTADHLMTDRTVQTLKRVLNQGMKVVLASGRSAASMRPFVNLVGTPFPYIAYNGAQIVDAITHRPFYTREIGTDLAREMLVWLEERDVYVQTYDGDDWFYEKPCAIAQEYAHSTGIQGTMTGQKLSAFLQRPTAKLLAVDEPARIQALMRESSEHFGDRLSITTSKPHFLEITSPEATKGNAVRALAERIGLSPETTICAGDSINDLPMLAWSRLPVTVANGRDELKRVAWRIAGDGREDGIADLLDELVPKGDSLC